MDITRYLRNHEWRLLPMSEVKEVVAEVRQNWGWQPVYSKLLTLPDEQTKFRKGDVPICGVSMLPHTMADNGINMCVNSTPVCRFICLVHTGRGQCSSTIDGRGWKTDLLVDHPNVWFTMFHHEIRAGFRRWPNLRVRPNVFSDVHWEKVLPDDFWTEFKKVRFMDYTKGWHRRRNVLPKNYRLVYSAAERTSTERIREFVDMGERVAVVFETYIPKKWEGMRVVNGDKDDDLWSRPAGTIVGLSPKGQLRKLKTNFKKKAA